jgi:hypothetical protein
MCAEDQTLSMMQPLSMSMNHCNESTLQVTEEDTHVLLVEDEYEEHYMKSLLELNVSKMSMLEECYLQQFIEEEQDLQGYDSEMYKSHATPVSANDLPSELPSNIVQGDLYINKT